jgi:hypothetical protein
MGFKKKDIKRGTYDVVDTIDPSFSSSEVAWIESLGGKPITMKSGESINEMVQKLINQTNGTQIKLLRIHGHGFPGFQAVASGKIRKPHQMAAITIDHFQKIKISLQRLKTSFSKAGEVYLMGCNVAEGNKGEELLQNLANLWGVPITGAAQTQYACEKGTKGISAQDCKAYTINYEGPVKKFYPG